jgi:hypothetical protein
MSYETMRQSLRRLAEAPVTADQPMTPATATAIASTMSKLTSSPEFQTFMAGKLKDLGKTAKDLTREEYDALVGEFITPVARMLAGK